MSELRLRRAGRDDEEGIRKLLAATFPENPKIDPGVMHWQYWGNPFGAAYSWVWEADGEVVSHYSALVVPVAMGDETALALVGVDAATAEAYRERGLFEMIVADALKIAAASPTPFTFYFTGGATRLPSAADASSVPFDLYVLPLRRRWLSSRLKLPGPIGGALLASVLRPSRMAGGEEVSGPPSGLGGLWRTVARHYPYSIVKDERWWAWRFGARPGAPYRYFERRDRGQLSGAAVAMLREGDERLVYVLEMLAVDVRAAKALATAIVEGFEGADAVAFRASPASHTCRIARSAGLVRVPGRFDPKPPRVAVFPHRDSFAALAGAPWSVTWGDMDHL